MEIDLKNDIVQVSVELTGKGNIPMSQINDIGQYPTTTVNQYMPLNLVKDFLPVKIKKGLYYIPLENSETEKHRHRSVIA